jgi:transcriptional regulator with XRE-family HTH domain
VLRDSEQSMSGRDPAAWSGARIRELRRDRGLTLKSLGRRAGLSHPFLSQLERGLARPSVGSVERIARALDVPVGALWTAPRPDVARLARAGDQDAPGGVRELFGAESALRVRELSGGSRRWPAEAETTAGEVLVYVVRGAIEVDLAGTVHALAAGDAISFDGTVPHRLRRRGPVTTRALYVATG